MRKQKLSPEASKAKAVRDKKIAMTPARRKKKAENQRIGQKPDSDLHHPGNGEKPVRVSISQNRGNFGNGTKNEGTNMMGQTWLNRKINGPSAIGEGDKKKGGVKPYVTYDRDDPRIQAHSDSLASYNNSNNEYYEHMKQRDEKDNASDAAYYSGLSDEDKEWQRARGAEYKPTPILSKQEYVSRGRKWAEPVTNVKYAPDGGDPSKKWHDINYTSPSTATSRSGTLIFPGTPGHSSMKNKSIKPTSFIQGDGYVRAVFFDKPKQKVILKGLEKMPILKGSSKLASPKIIDRKSTSRKFTTSLNNPNPIKNSMAYKNYGEVNFGDGTGNKVLNKDEFNKFEKLRKNK